MPDDSAGHGDATSAQEHRSILLRGGSGGFFAHRYVRRLAWSVSIVAVTTVAAGFALWWRLSSGPIELDIATPWLKAAIEKNFGSGTTVSVGGTQLERDEKGRPALRMRDIVVRDVDGTVVASAPKAEVGLSGVGLLHGSLQAHSLNLVEAELAVRIETDGRMTIFAGADKRPIATAAPALSQPRTEAPAAAVPSTLRDEFEDLTGLLAWIDGVGKNGLDGHDLRELGLKNGSLSVDDRRNGKQWNFDRINVSLSRPDSGGVIFRIESDNAARPWVISAAMRPLSDGIRAVGIEARKVSTRDLMLALRLDDSAIDADLPLSASIRADVAPDGLLREVQGQFIVDKGVIIDREKPSVRVAIDRAEFHFNWDGLRRTLVMPFQVQSGANQFTMRATLDPPAPDTTAWQLTVSRGDQVIDPVILGAAAGSDDEAFGINRIAVRARIDPARKRIDLDQGDFSRIDTRPLYSLGFAVTGSLDFSGEAHLAFGVAATRMPMSVMKRLWPVFVAADVRSWVEDHISAGTVERIVVAGNAPLITFKNDGPPTPDEGLAIDIDTSATTVRPIENLPAIRDADLNVHVTGRTATVSLGRGIIEPAPGRRLSIASGVFEVADTHLKPAPTRSVFRIDGTMAAAAALLASDGLRDNVNLALDPGSTRGTIAAQVTVNALLTKIKGGSAPTYEIAADLNNFAADKMLLGQKIEATLLKVTAGNDGYQVKGDAKINGVAANIDLRRQKGDTDSDLKMTATLDEAARRRIGLDFGSTVTGTFAVKATGRIGPSNKDDRLNVEADLTALKIDNLLPGWSKPAGKPARAVYSMIKTDKSTRIEDLSVEGSGATVKGAVEIDSNGDLISANFPVFSLSDGDKVALKAERGGDGALRVTMRGDVYDGRNFIKAGLAGDDRDRTKQKQSDLELDIKIGTVAGHNGETLRGLDLKLSRRGGRIRTFSLAAKIGRDTPLIGDLRLRSRDSHQVVYLETDDAGALFRLTDTYPRMVGGQIWVAMDPPTQEQTPQVGTVYLRSFAVRGEPALERVVSGAPGAAKDTVEFSEMQADFTRFPGKMAIRDGVVRGPLIGATIEGQIDYTKDDVHLRGTFVPFYGLNNLFGQIPIVGLFLGGSNEGLLGITYEAVGPPSAPRISVNPVTAIAPGLLRKFIPSPGSFDKNFIPPTR